MKQRVIPKTKARLSILNRLLAFPTINQKDWESNSFIFDVKKGDLVFLNCVREATEWYLSWVVDFNVISPGNPTYLLESIESGKLCWWNNVGINVYKREELLKYPSWRWSDCQYAFKKRWIKTAYKNDGYTVLPIWPVFKNDSVILNVRIRWEEKGFTNLVTFPNWKKVTIKMMDDYFKDSVHKYNKLKDLKS